MIRKYVAPKLDKWTRDHVKGIKAAMHRPWPKRSGAKLEYWYNEQDRHREAKGVVWTKTQCQQAADYLCDQLGLLELLKITTVQWGPSFYMYQERKIYLSHDNQSTDKTKYGPERKPNLDALTLCHEFAHHLNHLNGISGHNQDHARAMDECVRIVKQMKIYQTML